MMGRRDALLAAASVLLAAAAAELWLRWRAPARFSLGARGFFAADAELGYDIAPDDDEGESFSNELACRDRPYDRRAAPRPVLLLGDSFAQGGPYATSWGARLEEHLGERVLKCGVAGYGTRQQLAKARRVMAAARTSPRLIVLGYFVNDLNDDYEFPSRTVVGGRVASLRGLADPDTGRMVEHDRADLERQAEVFERVGEYVDCPRGGLAQRMRCGLYERSILYRRLKEPLKRLLRGAGAAPPAKGPYLGFRSERGKPWLRRAWDAHLRNLDAFAALARQRNASLLVVLIPLKEQVYPELFPAFAAEHPGARPEGPFPRVAARLRARGAAVLDLREELGPYARARPIYLRGDLHWNADGEELAALLTARAALRAGLVDVPDRAARLKSIEDRLSAFKQML